VAEVKVSAGEPFEGTIFFEEWWSEFYGKVEDYGDEEFWIHKWFANEAWKARGESA